MSDRRRAYDALLELLERQHGLGTRAAWVQARLDRALDALVGEVGSVGRALELVQNDPARLAELADLLRVGETSFYRDPPQWEALRRALLPALGGRERLRGLSVGCSTGEETWTLAMLLAEACGEQRPFRVVGLDRSEAALASAREAVYPAESARNLPAELATRFLEPRAGSVRVRAELAPNVTFTPRDAMNGPPPGSYELIVCKNLLIYFGDAAAARIVESLLRALDDDGVLVVARSEIPRLRAVGARADEIAPGITVFRA